jgi:hypothetical protein
MVKQYRKKPVVIEAMQWTEDNLQNIINFCPDCFTYEKKYKQILAITTLEGTMTASPGDYIIKGVAGEFYACKPDIFEKTYDTITD